MPTLAPNESYSNALPPGVQLRVSGAALVELVGIGTLPVSGSRVLGPYSQAMPYRITAIEETIFSEVRERYIDRPAIEPLFTLNFGDAGLAIPPNTAETWIGPEIALPAGAIRPGDIVREIGLIEYVGTLDSGTRTLRTRISAAPGVSTGSVALCMTSNSSTSNLSLNVDKVNVIASNILRRAMANSVYAGGASNLAATAQAIPDLSLPVFLRASAQNQSAGITMIIHHYALWLERGGL